MNYQKMFLFSSEKSIIFSRPQDYQRIVRKNTSTFFLVQMLFKYKKLQNRTVKKKWNYLMVQVNKYEGCPKSNFSFFISALGNTGWTIFTENIYLYYPTL